jgi:hypothetical protein
MSIFAGLNVKLVETPRENLSGGNSHNPLGNNPPKSVFEGLQVTPVESEGSQADQQREDSWGRFAARTGKSAVAGAVGGLADTAAAAYNIPASLTNAANDLNKDNPWELDPVSGMPVPNSSGERAALPLIPSATEAIDQGIDQATGDYTRTPEQEKWFQEGIKFAASVGAGGGLGPAAGRAGRKGAETALNLFGSTKPSTILGAGASGAAMQKAHEWETSAPLAFGSSIGAGLVTEAALNVMNPKNIARRATAGIGFGKNSLNVPAVESAKKLNIDLPGIAATKAVAPAFAHQILSKFPYFGDKLKEKIKTASDQYQKAWDTMLDSVGAPKIEVVSQNIDKSYNMMRRTIPKDAAVLPTPILEAIASVEGKLKTAVHSDPTKKLFSVCEEFKKAFVPPPPKLPDGFEKFSASVQKKILDALAKDAKPVSPISVKKLVRQKVELNKIMKDRNVFDRHDTDSLGFLHELRDGVTRTLENYGATNPGFLKALKSADEGFARTARREALDDALSGKIVDVKTGEVSYNSLLSVLNDRKQQKFLKNHLGQANYKKLEDFVKVAKAMESVKRNNPNPSSSASMGASIGFVISILHGNFTIPAITTGGGTVATRLLTSKKFLNKATQFAKEPTVPLADKLAAIVKENTGMTIQALQKAMRGEGEG